MAKPKAKSKVTPKKSQVQGRQPVVRPQMLWIKAMQLSDRMALVDGTLNGKYYALQPNTPTYVPKGVYGILKDAIVRTYTVAGEMGKEGTEKYVDNPEYMVEKCEPPVERQKEQKELHDDLKVQLDVEELE